MHHIPVHSRLHTLKLECAACPIAKMCPLRSRLDVHFQVFVTMVLTLLLLICLYRRKEHCMTQLACVQNGLICGASNTCMPCGGAQQPACPHPAPPCQAGLFNENSLCVPAAACGDHFQRCCENNSCKANDLSCDGGTCRGCGRLNQAPCPGVALLLLSMALPKLSLLTIALLSIEPLGSMIWGETPKIAWRFPDVPPTKFGCKRFNI
jgi:hypothetical protein